MILPDLFSESAVQNLGQIKFMSLPPDWAEDRRIAAIRANSFLTWFHPPGDGDITIGFFFRGKRAGRLASRNFHELLSLPPHSLKPAELQSLDEVLDDSADPAEFTMESAATEWLNRRHVLVVQGVYIRAAQQSRTIYIDADGTGSAIQEIYYAAPAEQFAVHLAEALEAFNSIKWI